MSNRQIPKIIKQALPSVVSIIITKEFKKIESEAPHELLPTLHSRQYRQKLKDLAGTADKYGMVEIGGGSGFIVNEGGIVVTNRHVIAEPNAAYTCLTGSGQSFAAEVLARDPSSDIAILKLHVTPETIGPVHKLPTLKLGDATKMELGETVIAIGNSLGLFRNTVSVGIVSGLSRSIRAQVDKDSPIEEMRGLIQTDAAINPGNSGGPLLNLKGEVIAINTATVAGAQNIGFAIPINSLKRDLEDLKKYGRIRRPLLGIRYLTITPALKRKVPTLPVNQGAVIVCEDEHTPGIIKDSPADRAGLMEKDIIISVNNRDLTSDYTVKDILNEAEVGDKLKIITQRGSRTLKVTLTLTERK